MTHAQYAEFTVIFGLAMALVPQIIGLVVAVAPSSRFSLPNRDYWLAPKRKDATIAWLRGHLAWLGCFMLVFMGTIHASIVRANAPGAGNLNTGTVGPIIGGFAVGVLAWAVWLVVHFARRPKAQGQAYVGGPWSGAD